jgi:hypothetical protein
VRVARLGELAQEPTVRKMIIDDDRIACVVPAWLAYSPQIAEVGRPEYGHAVLVEDLELRDVHLCT